MNDSAFNDYADISATDFKLKFGKTLDDVAHGKTVRIIRHGRTTGRLVLMREEDLDVLHARLASPLDELRDRFDDMVKQMQTPKSRKAAASIGTASGEALGKAALKRFKRGA